MEFEEENADVENSPDNHGHSFRDSFAGKSLCSELGNQSDIVPLSGCLASDISTADLLSSKNPEANVFIFADRQTVHERQTRAWE